MQHQYQHISIAKPKKEEALNVDVSIVLYHFATYYFRFDNLSLSLCAIAACIISFFRPFANDFHLTFAPIRCMHLRVSVCVCVLMHIHSCTVSACLMRI